MSQGIYSIKEAATRTNLSPAQLRQWERRYGFPRPVRSEGKQRLFSEAELKAILEVRRYIDEGSTVAQAIKTVKTSPAASLETSSQKYVLRLKEALIKGNVSKADLVLSEAFRFFSFDEVMLDIIAELLSQVGDEWHQGKLSIAQEHMTSSYISSRLFELFRWMGESLGKKVVVTSVPGETHHLGALMVSVYLKRAGLGVYFLGADTPLADLKSFAKEMKAEAVLLSCTLKKSLSMLSKNDLKNLAPVVVIGGRAAEQHPEEVSRLGATYLGNHPRTVAEDLYRLISPD